MEKARRPIFHKKQEELSPAKSLIYSQQPNAHILPLYDIIL